MKVLTHRPRYLEPAVVPEFCEGTSSTAKVKQVAPNVQSAEEAIVVPKVPTVGPAEAEDDKAEEPQVEKIVKCQKFEVLQQRQNFQKCRKLLPQLPIGEGWPMC
jgi:hypothetical protein